MKTGAIAESLPAPGVPTPIIEPELIIPNHPPLSLPLLPDSPVIKLCNS